MVFIGFIMPFILGYFIDVTDVQTSPLIDSVVDFVEDGIEIDLLGLVDFNINPFAMLGSTLQGYLVDSFTYLGLFPDFLVISILLIIGVSFIYSVFSLIRG